jgi:hypothetical protein
MQFYGQTKPQKSKKKKKMAREEMWMFEREEV